MRQGGDRVSESAQASGTAGNIPTFSDLGPLGATGEAADEVAITFKDKDAKPVEMKGRAVLTALNSIEAIFSNRQPLSKLTVAVLLPSGRRGIDGVAIDRFSQMFARGRSGI